MRRRRRERRAAVAVSFAVFGATDDLQRGGHHERPEEAQAQGGGGRGRGGVVDGAERLERRRGPPVGSRRRCSSCSGSEGERAGAPSASRSEVDKLARRQQPARGGGDEGEEPWEGDRGLAARGRRRRSGRPRVLLLLLLLLLLKSNAVAGALGGRRSRHRSYFLFFVFPASFSASESEFLLPPALKRADSRFQKRAAGLRWPGFRSGVGEEGGSGKRNERVLISGQLRLLRFFRFFPLSPLSPKQKREKTEQSHLPSPGTRAICLRSKQKAKRKSRKREKECGGRERRSVNEIKKKKSERQKRSPPLLKIFNSHSKKTKQKTKLKPSSPPPSSPQTGCTRAPGPPSR